MQRLKTRVIEKDVNPEWNEDLTLTVTDPNSPIKLVIILSRWVNEKRTLITVKDIG